MVAVFFGHSQTWPVTLRIVFSGCTVASDSKKTILESSNQEASPSAAKHTEILSQNIPGHKITPRVGISWTHNLCFYFEPFLTQWIMAMLSKGCEPDNFELPNSLKLTFTNIWGLCLTFIDCESFLESNSPDILALCENPIDFGNSSARGYLPLIQKNSTPHINDLAVYSRNDFLLDGAYL